MNERIRELMVEANPSGDFSDCEWVFEKFAELIVRECAGIYEKIDNGNLHMNTDDYLEALHRTFRS